MANDINLTPPEKGYGAAKRGWQLHKRGEWLRKPGEKVYFHCATSTLWKKKKDGFVRADAMHRVAVGGFMGMGKSFLKRCCLLAWRREVQRERKWESMPTECEDVPADDRALEFCLAEAALEFDSPYGRCLPLPRISPEKCPGGDDSQAMDPPPRRGWRAAKKKKSKWSYNPQAPDWLLEPIEGVYFHTPSKTLWRELETSGGVWSDEEVEDADDRPLRLRCVDAPNSQRCSVPSLSEAMRSAALQRRCFTVWAGERRKPQQAKERVEKGLPAADPRELAERIFADSPIGQPHARLEVSPAADSAMRGVSPAAASALRGTTPPRTGSSNGRIATPPPALAIKVEVAEKNQHDSAVDRAARVNLLANGNGQNVQVHQYAKVDPQLRPGAGNALRKKVPVEKKQGIEAAPKRRCCRRRQSKPASVAQVKRPSAEAADLDDFPDSPRALWDVEVSPAVPLDRGDLGRREDPEEDIEDGYRRQLNFGQDLQDLPMEVLRLESPEDLDIYAVPETRI